MMDEQLAVFRTKTNIYCTMFMYMGYTKREHQVK